MASVPTSSVTFTTTVERGCRGSGDTSRDKISGAGAKDGAEVGEVGNSVEELGSMEGWAVGAALGYAKGWADGMEVGCVDGTLEGPEEGLTDGRDDGCTLGVVDG